MKTRNLFILVVLIVALGTVGTYAYFPDNSFPEAHSNAITINSLDCIYMEQFRGMDQDQIVLRVWQDICHINSDFPDSNLVRPGDFIVLPCDVSMHRGYVAKKGGTDHMWKAAEYYVTNYVTPYLDGTLLPPTVQEPDTTITPDTVVSVSTTDDDGFLGWYWLIAALAAFGIWLFIRYLNRDRRQTEEHLTALQRQREQDRKFVSDPPDFDTASDSAVHRSAQIAVTRACGPHAQVVGDIKRGHFTGTVEMLGVDGATTTEQFDHEPGYQARVRFSDGTETDMFCRWACFNPVYNAQGGKCDGTFVEEGSDTPQLITEITPEQMDALKQSVKGEHELTSDDLPTVDASGDAEEPTTSSDDEPAAVPTEDAPEVSTDEPKPPVATTPDPEHQIVKIGGCQVSKSRLTLDTFEGTPAQLDKVLGTLTKHSKAMADDQ